MSGVADPASDAATRAGRLGLRERWMAMRARLLASSRFQRLAAATPFIRPFARRRARALFDVVAGFVYSQTLAACVRLDLFEIVAAAPIRPEALARRVDLEVGALERLVDAAAALSLLERTPDGRVGLGELGAALRGAPGVAEMVRHHALLYADLSDPVALLRGETTPQTAAYWGYAEADAPAALDASHTGTYSALMAATQPFVAEETLDAYPFRRHRRLLDVGGGRGVFVRAALERAPGLRATVFDLPAVATEARRALADVSDRVDTVGGSFFDDPLPTGADLATLVRVLYDHSDDRALAILRRVREALPPGGVVLVAEPMSGATGAAPIGDAYYNWYLLAMKGGRSRRPEQIGDLLVAAGFDAPRRRRTRRPLLTQVVTATAPQ